MEVQARSKWVVVFGIVLASIGSQAKAGVTVQKIVFQGRGANQPEIQLVVTGSKQAGYAAQLWKGDYLWSSCRQAAAAKGKLSFECGRQKLKMDWRGEEYRDEGIRRALLTDRSGTQEPIEPITASL